MTTSHHIAFDLGAESGRVMLGTLGDDGFALEEIHRFATGPVRILGTLRWNVLDIFNQLKVGLKKVARRGIDIRSISTDSWGVDYVLLRTGQPMLAIPFHYRDARTNESYDEALRTVPAETIFAETGIQFMSINTLYQFIADVKHNGPVLDAAERFLNIGDYINYLFSGVQSVEVSMASTTQLYNPQNRSWSKRLIEAFGLPARLFPPIISSGSVLGPVLPEIIEETHLSGSPSVIATCSHDTAAAVAAVPADDGTDDWAYLSSGTWSLMGVELDTPLINEQVRRANFTNEIGYGNRVRFLKNIVGLWILQECRRAWADAGKEYGYDELTRLAEQADPFVSLIDPGDGRFIQPDDMPDKIAAYCRETDQPEPQSPGQFVRCVLESLALLYRKTLDQIESLTGRHIARLHIVGGGSQNMLLNRLTAGAIARPVMTGPVEATAAGNVLIQALALGQLESLADLRRAVAEAFEPRLIQPDGDEAAWRKVYRKFTELTGG